MTTDFSERFFQLIAKFVELVGTRRPSQRVIPLALTGAVMVWTPDGNIVVDPHTARQLAVKLNRLADLAEFARPKDLFSKGQRK